MANPERPGRADQDQAPPVPAGSAAAPPGDGRPRRAHRTRSIRVTLVALLLVPLLALVGLWAFLASLTLGNALTAHHNNHITVQVSQAARVALNAVGAERQATFLWLSSPLRPPVSQLAASRRADDAAIGFYERSSGAVPGQAAVIADLGKIPGIRSAIDSRALNAPAAFQAYSAVVDGLFNGYLTNPQYDTSLYKQTLAAIDLGWALEELSREATLVAGAEVDRGQMSPAEGVLFARAAGAQNLLAGTAIAEFNDPLQATLQRLYTSPLHAQLAALEDRIAGTARGQALTPATLKAWGPVSGAFLGQLLAGTVASEGPLATEEGRTSNRLFLEAGLAGGLGLLAVVVAVFLSVRFSRGIRRELTGLHDGAARMAHERLPRVVARLREGDEVDVAAESPPLAVGTITEIARVADAFSTVQRTAVDAAVGQANLRKGVNQVFLNLSLRNQSLLHRQLGMLDTMERGTDDAAVLADLFRLDHLTTRMRRHAEGLIILSGATPGRGWRDPVPVLDVLRAAIAEVEDYVRVDVVSEPPDSVVGSAVNDVIHLIAELIENATTFSPPNTRVEVRAEAVGVGFAVEVEDRGLGMTAEELAGINARLTRPPEFDLANSDRLGLFVVGQLAVRHQIRVSLRESHYGGTTAIVLLPHSVIVRAGEPGPSGTVGQHVTVNGSLYPPAESDPVANRERASAFGPTGRHRSDALPEPRPGLSAAGTVRPAGPPWSDLAGASGLSAAAPRAPLPDPLRPAPGQEPSRQRFAWDSLGAGASEPTSGRSGTVPPGPSTAPQADLDQIRRSAAEGTHRGLPRRVRQASLAPQLRDRGESAAEPAGDSASRSPEEMRNMMASLQDGWQRGRVDHLDHLDDGPGDWLGGGNDGGASS
ncbi:MAG TPA: nitrate- and nitrite sensing domain-containing protein [Streptosporangiaceae bacterium]|nr:nitrate- and nitrite sensing domain-containing protein [Streptosporangiaceae bacterium]